MKIHLGAKTVVMSKVGIGNYFVERTWESKQPDMGPYTWAVRADKDMVLNEIIVGLYQNQYSCDIRVKLFSSDGTLKKSFLQSVRTDAYIQLNETLDVKQGDYIAFSSGESNIDIPEEKRAGVLYNAQGGLEQYYMDGDVDVFNNPMPYSTIHKIAFVA